YNQELAQELGLKLDKNDLDVFAGNKLPEGSVPLSMAYAGHQFGYFTILGDGRAVLLGEQITPEGKRFDIQLKGSGRTPYSRGGDGRAVLGPMLREYIISEAMHSMKIPTTRSLAVVTTGEPVYRESVKAGAVLTRVASSHIRVGTFEFAAKKGTKDDVRALADYTIARHFPSLQNDENRYVLLLKEVVQAQASLIALWLLTGFIHGVMNTDNMAISGETIDYGPCAFMDIYDPDTVFSSIDYHGRYAYQRQPKMAVWNLARFSETLLPLLSDHVDQAVQIAKEAIDEFHVLFHEHWMSGMRKKLGLFQEEDQDQALFDDLLNILRENKADYTNTFRALTIERPEDIRLNCSAFDNWYTHWDNRRSNQTPTKDKAMQMMKNANPSVIPRNHRVEDALVAAEDKNDLSIMEKLLHVLKDPYAYSPDQEEYAQLPRPSSCIYRTYCGT
ncbi:MAG TPA: YdiU family protein, partial [Clostridiales bacterium]|nr:YdiU family protein [Clostridiales bacterium]